jgi:AcrR family transcriptional regulator
MPIPPAPRRRNATTRGDKRTKTMARLIDAAERLISLRGYEGTSAADIAAEAGVGPSLINAYFLSKAGLLYAVQRRFNDQQFAATRVAAARPGSATERLAGILQTWAELDLAEPRLYAAVCGLTWMWSPETEREYAADLAIFWDVVMGVINDGIAEGAFRPISRADATDMIFAIHQWGMRPGIYHGVPPAECADAVVRQVLHALATVRPPSG